MSMSNLKIPRLISSLILLLVDSMTFVSILDARMDSFTFRSPSLMLLALIILATISLGFLNLSFTQLFSVFEEWWRLLRSMPLLRYPAWFCRVFSISINLFLWNRTDFRIDNRLLILVHADFNLVTLDVLVFVAFVIHFEVIIDL